MKFIAFAVILLLCSCDMYTPKKEDLLIGQIIAEVKEEMVQKYDMHLIGTGSGEDKGICMLGLSFAIYRPLERGEARYLVLTAAETFLTKINAKEELRPFLKNYPFTDKNIQIFYSSYASRKLEDTYDPYISGGYLDEHGITYLTDDPERQYHYKSTYTESYEEALEILRKQNNSQSYHTNVST